MNKIYVLLFCLISLLSFSQDEVSADWSVSVEGTTATLSINNFNNFTVGLDGHWHYILNDDEYVAVHDINDVIIPNLAAGNHSITVWLVDHMHNALDPPVEETITFEINTGLSTTDNKILDMMFYPNPADGNYVTILSAVEGLKEIQVFTVTGKKVLDTVNNENTIDISSFNSGIYMLKVTVDGQSKISKLVVR